MFFVYTSGNKPRSYAVRFITGGKYDHVLIAFEKPGEHFYYESIWKKDPVTGKTGVRGPVPWKELEDWLAESPQHRMYEQALPYDGNKCRQAVKFLEAHVGRIRYAYWQLWQNVKSFLFGMGIRPGAASRDKWTCSETVAQVWAEIDPGAALKYLLGYLSFDQIAPSGPRFGLKEAVEKYLADTTP